MASTLQTALGEAYKPRMTPGTSYDRSPQSRLDPELSGRFRRSDLAKPTRGARLLEWSLFAVVCLLLIVGTLALHSSFSRDYREVPNRVAAGVQSDRVNVLLIGVGGDAHPGGGRDLADSIVLASFRPSTREVTLLSVPRDLYVDLGRYGRHRINRAHAIGTNSGYPGGGPALVMDAVSDLFGVPVHAFVRVDFEGFEKIIDSLGGIEVDVKHGFYDYLFGDRFIAGRQRMNGDRALRYARYRYVIGPEGTTFSREERQRQVLTAIVEKLRRQGVRGAATLLRTARTFSSYSDTNLDSQQIVWFYRHFSDVDLGSVRNVSLEPYLEEFEVKRLGDAGEALRPRNSDYVLLRRVVRDAFSSTSPDRGEIVRGGVSELSLASPAITTADIQRRGTFDELSRRTERKNRRQSGR